jgi:hypothetical protein
MADGFINSLYITTSLVDWLIPGSVAPVFTVALAATTDWALVIFCRSRYLDLSVEIPVLFTDKVILLVFWKGYKR